MEKFHYVIARKWDERKPLEGSNICKYTIHNADVFYGNMRDAASNLEYVTSNNEKDYKILKIQFTVV